ncbi:leucine-rich repeat-containing protein [Pelomyxa schiedti]|nr:leucine-rich repeat-containing protein [Pelomyxa schiedti]
MVTVSQMAQATTTGIPQPTEQIVPTGDSGDSASSNTPANSRTKTSPRIALFPTIKIHCLWKHGSHTTVSQLSRYSRCIAEALIPELQSDELDRARALKKLQEQSPKIIKVFANVFEAASSESHSSFDTFGDFHPMASLAQASNISDLVSPGLNYTTPSESPMSGDSTPESRGASLQSGMTDETALIFMLSVSDSSIPYVWVHAAHAAVDALWCICLSPRFAKLVHQNVVVFACRLFFHSLASSLTWSSLPQLPPSCLLESTASAALLMSSSSSSLLSPHVPSLSPTPDTKATGSGVAPPVEEPEAPLNPLRNASVRKDTCGILWRLTEILTNRIDDSGLPEGGGLQQRMQINNVALQSAVSRLLKAFPEHQRIQYHSCKLMTVMIKRYSFCWEFVKLDGLKVLSSAARLLMRTAEAIPDTLQELRDHIINVGTCPLRTGCSYSSGSGETTCVSVLYNALLAEQYQELVLTENITSQALAQFLPSLYPFSRVVMSNLGLDSVPIEIGNLSNLVQVDLSHNQLGYVPCSFAKLEKLELLNVEYNKIDRLFPGFGLHPTMKLMCQHNPLKGIPFMARNSPKNLKTYLKDLNEDMHYWNRVRILVVGEESAGKTSLIRRLQSRKFKSNSLATNGIEVASKQVSIGESTLGPSVKFMCWDFGGQVCFYPTHQFFLSPKALYLVTFSLEKFQLSTIDYWLQQIEAISSKDQTEPPVILCGTHSDVFPSLEEATIQIQSMLSRYKQRFHNIKGAIALSNSTGIGINSLKTLLLKVAKDTKLTNIEIPTSYYCLSKRVISLQKASPGMRVMPWMSFYQLANQVNLFCPVSVQLAAEFLCSMGYLLHYNHGLLADVVFMDMQWVANVMATLISFTHNFGKRDGLLRPEDLKQILKGSTTNSLEFIELLVKFNIAHVISSNDSLLIPCLLSDACPNMEWPPQSPNDSLTSPMVISACSRYYRLYEFRFLPLGFMGRLITQILQSPNISMLNCWKDGLIITDKLHPQFCLFKYDPELCTVSLDVALFGSLEDPKASLLRICIEMIEALAECSYPRLFYCLQRRVPCNHCKALSTASVFKYEDIVSLYVSGQTDVKCNGDSVTLEDLAPDITFTDIPVLKDVRIVRKLGEGGFGAVYQGMLNTSSWVAVKELLGSGEDTVQKFTQFQRETAIMNFLHHPNLVSLLGITLTPPRMVLEFIPGGDLSHFMHPQAEKTISQEEFDWVYRLNIAIDIARGMEYLQKIKPPVIHRDLRPANIFLTGTTEGPIYAKVADFGLSRRVSEMNDSLPNWEWLAPEVYSTSSVTKKYDCSTDVYSFGLILYEMEALRIPYSEFREDPRYNTTAGTNKAGKPILRFQLIKFKNAIEEGLRPTLLESPEIPLGYNELMKQCWDNDPTNRPTFSQIYEDLTRIYANNDCSSQQH